MQTIYLGGSSIIEEGTQILDLEKEFYNEESEKPPHFNEEDGYNLATFRERNKSKSDINYTDEDLEEIECDDRAAKTAFNKNRILVNNSKETMKKVHPSQNHINNSDLQSQLQKLGISSSEKDKLNDHIYLNTNSAEENPDEIHGIVPDSESLSKHTLRVQTHSSEIEGESGMSYKEIILYSNKNMQVSPKEAPFIDKN